VALLEFISHRDESVVFAGSPRELADPANAYGFGFTSNDDWYSTGPSKSSVEERPVADGAYGILRDWRPGLALQFVGWYRGPDRAAVRAARRDLQRIIANGHEVLVRFVDEDESTLRGVSVRSMVPTANSGLYFRVTIDAVALDPVAYGERRTFSTGVPVSGGGLLWPLGSS
jgi:hypothetical protein